MMRKRDTHTTSRAEPEGSAHFLMLKEDDENFPSADDDEATKTNERIKEETVVTTKDFGLSCLLMSNRCEMITHRLDERGQVWIEFQNTEKARQLEQAFYNGTAQVNLADYLSCHKTLKTLIFNLRRNAYGDQEYELHRRISR